MRRRILLGQLGARGDCLYAAAVARQIKTDLPGCHLTWAVGSHCRSLVEGNPHVDAIWEIPVTGHEEMARSWWEFEREAGARKRNGEFDEIYLTQIHPGNIGNFDGTVRASIFRGYPRPITVPLTAPIRLGPEAVDNVRSFRERNGLAELERVILFEFSAKSGQSFVTPELARDVARKVVGRLPRTGVVLSSDSRLGSDEPGLIDGSELSFLENAELMRHCSLLVGCSSGISWLCAVAAGGRPPRMIQLLKRSTSVFASFVHDHEYHGLPTGHIIEMTDCSAGRIADCIVAVYEENFETARQRFHERIPLRFRHYGKVLKGALARGEVRAVWRSAGVTIARYGPHPHLLATLLWSMRGAFGRRSKPGVP